MKKCKKCGAELTRKGCPNGCKQKNGCLTSILIVIVIMFASAAVMGVLFGEEESSSAQNSSVTSSVSEETSSQEKINKYETKKDLITFEDVKAEFVKLYNPNAGVTALAVALNLQNNGTEEITVSLSDGYVNDTKVQFMTGLPVTIAPGKKAVGVFMFGYDGLGFSKVEDIEKMEFKISLLNSNWNALKTSEKIELNFK